MKDVLQTYKFDFKFNAQDSKKQLKAISNDMIQMIREMDTASNKMQVFTNFVGYLERLDYALNQFKIEHKNDFANLFGDADGQLTQSLESAFGLSTKKLELLGGLKGRIDNALASKASTEDLRTIAQDINTLFVAIGRSEELDINGLFTGKGNLNERINALSNALYKFYLQYQLLTSSVKNGLASGGAQGFAGLSEDVQQEVKRLSDAYDELITIQQKLQKAQADIDKIHSKNNKKVVDQYKIELTEESVSQLMTEFDLLDEQIKSGDSSSQEYYENLLKITDVILKLNSALKTIRNDKSLMTVFQGVSVGEGYSHMFDKLSKYTTVKATQFENSFLGKTLTEGLEKIMKESRTRIENVFTSGMTGLGGGFGNGSGSGNGDGEKQVSIYKQLVTSLKEYAKAYKEYKALEEGDGPEDELEEKGDHVDELREKIYQLVKLSDDASDEVSTIFNVYENGKYNFDQLVDELTKVLGITKEINEEGSGKKLKTYNELLTIFEKINALGMDETDFNDSSIQKLVKDLKDLYAAEEQLEDVDDILRSLVDGEIDDIAALNQLTKLFGIDIPDGVKIASQKIDEFYDKIKAQHALGLESEFSAGEYKVEMELLKSELQELREQGRITESQFEDIERAFDEDVKGYVDAFIGRNNILSELNKLNKDASLTDEESALEVIVQKRREILATAEQNGTLLDEQLSEERAITNEIEKRIGLKKQDGSGSGSGSGRGESGGDGTGTGSGSSEGSGSGSDDASEENEQYQRLLQTIRDVEKAVNDKTAAFVHEKETVDDVAAQEIESLRQIAEYLETIRTAVQDVFGTKQGIVNSSVKEWQQALESIHNTMQAISNMQSVEEMLSRMAANALDIKNNLNFSGDGTNVGPGSHVTETITNVDFTSLEGTIKSEISSLIGKLDNVLKVEVVKSDTEEIKTAINNIKTSIDNIATSIKDYKSNAGDQQKTQIDAMKNNLLQLQQFVSNFNNRMISGKYQAQELTGAILSDGSISVGYGEDGEVPWDRVASSLVANLNKALLVDLHSHPLRQLTTGQVGANDAFSGSKGDLSAFNFSKSLGAKLAAEITGNVIRTLDVSKISATNMMKLKEHLAQVEREYARNPAYSKFITYDEQEGKIKTKQQSDLQGRHQVTQILESMMYEAFKRVGYSKEKVDSELFKKYDLTDDKQLTALATTIVQLSNASTEAVAPLDRLKTIISLFDGETNTKKANTAFEAFTKGELNAADVFNQLNGKGYKVNQETMDSLFRIDSANEMPAIESLLNQVTSVLNTISSSVSSIDSKITSNIGSQFDSALDNMMDFNGINDLGTKITDRIMASAKSRFDQLNVSEYKVKELSDKAMLKAQELSGYFKNVSEKNGQMSVFETQTLFDNFVSTMRAMSDAINQEELYRDRTGQKLLNDSGKRSIADDLFATFESVFNPTNINTMRELLARGKVNWQAEKVSYGDTPDAKVDPIAQNIDSLTAAIGELKTIVGGLQQYIASPQFTIKADTSALEESLSTVSAEINTGAQKIADAVNEFGSKTTTTSVEQSQLSIDKNEMTMAMKEALYAKEFASNYAKVEWSDIMDFDWITDEYMNRLTGEVFSTFEEADRHFDENFSNFYKSLDESFIGTKEAAFEDLLLKNQNKDDDFATVIVRAIQDQTGKIVNAIKVVLPDSISSSASTNGEIANEEQIESAFQYIAKRASKWSDMTDRNPRDFFNSILRRNGNVQMDSRLEDALHTLGMLSPSGEPTFKVAQEGLRNLGVAIAEDFALPSRPIELNQVSELVPLLNEAAKLGAAIPRIVSSFTDVDRVFELQTKMKGSNIASSFDWLSATTEQIDGLIHTLEVLNKVGLYPDFIGDNVLFDQNKGFSLVDIETQPLKFGLDSAEDMGRWFVKYLTHMDWDGRDYEFQNFIDLFEERLMLPPEQRLVNESIVAQSKKVASVNNDVSMSGFDASIDKIALAATALNDAAVRLGNVADALTSGKASDNTDAEIDIYDPYEYPDRKVMHFGELYSQEDDMSKKAIDDLALFTREYDQLWDTMTKEPIDIFDTAYPTDAEKAQILDIFEQIKQKNLEISNNSFVTEEELQRLRQLKAEVKGLQNELKGASLGFGFAEDYWENYRDIYGLGNFDAQMFADYIHGDDMHSSFTGQLSNMLQDKMVNVYRQIASGELNDALIRGTKEFNQFLAEHAKKLLGEQSIFDPTNAGYQQSDSGNINEESTALQGLASEVSAVEQAVRNKTAAFEAEGAIVNKVVEGEIAALRELSDILNTIQTALQTIFSGNVYNFGNLDLLPDSINDRAETSVFQEIQQTLGQILTVLQGFTGLESDGENSLKHKEPVVDNGARTFDMSDALANKLNDLATEGTLVAIKDVVAQIADTIKANNDSEADNNINSNLNTLISALSANITSLKEVMDGVVVHQKAQKSDTRKAMARIQDPKQNQLISGLAKSAVDSIGDEAEVESLQALANGLVKVEGAFKNAEGQWQGFTVKINEHNEAVDLAVKKHSSFARLLNKGMPIEDDNPFIFSKDEVEKRAKKHLEEYAAQGKNATVQFKDSGRYTITILEEIDGLSKQIFQTFDENDEKIERTTVTMSNSQKMKLDNLQKKLIENGIANDLISDKDSVYNDYQNASDALNNMTIAYSKLDDISDVQIDQWKQQIALVQQLGSQVEALIKQRKLANDQNVFESDRSKKLSKFDLDKANLYSNIDMSKVSKDLVDDIDKKRSAIANATDADSLKIAINNWDELQNKIKAAAVQQDLYIKKTKEVKQEPDQFTKDLTKQKKDFTKYKTDAENALGVSQELKDELNELETRMSTIGSVSDLVDWIQDFKNLKTEISNAQKSFKVSQKAKASDIAGEANAKFAKDLNFKATDSNLTDEQKEIKNARAKLLQQIAEYNIKVESGQEAEIRGIEEIRDKLYELIDAYKKKYNIASNAGNTKKGQAFGLNQLQNFTARYNSLIKEASNMGFDNQAPVVANLINAYRQLQAAQSAFVAGEDKTTNVYARKVEVFKAAQFECNNYARELNRVITSSKKLEADSVVSDVVSEDFQDDIEGRKVALKDFVNSIYGSRAAIGDFDKKFNELNFTVKNGDGTFTQMTATINQARTAIYATSGATKELSSGFSGFMSSVVSKFKSIIPYLTASFGWQEIWQQVRQGITYVKEIDSALTELKKVTSETDATYDNFLQSMSKTAGVVGSTVSELTTMAADWARLGYSIEEAGKLAESTAILLNVSEFQDATSASEALISTMQAFQYTADESQHVVDILNEVGNNYAVSSDGIATALQDSASALMEAGNNLEQSVALVAAANKVVQDPDSVGSALRTISLRLRGTSVEVLEELGEETDGVVASISKMQEKIGALTGVNILTDSGAYKDTYTILQEIGEVWEDMSDIDQAALLELMAGKNRANTLAAILGNMEDLEGAYESALGAEGSAQKENEAYLDSIQGRVDLFNNALQTMWMNFINDDVVKFIVDVGTALIKAADSIGVLGTAIGGFVGIKSAIKSVKDELNSLNEAKIFKRNIFENIFDQHDLDVGEQTKTSKPKDKTMSKREKKITELEKKLEKARHARDKAYDNWDAARAAKQEEKIKMLEDALKNLQSVDVTPEINISAIDSQIDAIKNKMATIDNQIEMSKFENPDDWDYFDGYVGSDDNIKQQLLEYDKLKVSLNELLAKRHELTSSSSSADNKFQESLEEQNEAIRENIDVTESANVAAKQHGEAKMAEKASVDASATATGIESGVKDVNTQKTWAQVAAEKALAVAKGLVKGLLIGAAVSVVTAAFTGMISAISDAAKRMDELTDSAIKTAEKTREAQDSISDYKDEVSDLGKVLNDNASSEIELYDARKRLIEIQNELIDKFGLEAEGLNLVTDAINGQTAALDKLSQKSASNWMKENMEAYENAKNEMEKTYDSNNELLLFSHSDGYLSGTLSNASKDLIDVYKNGLKKIIENELGGTLSESVSASTDELGNILYSDNIYASFKNKTVEELDQIFDAIQTYLLDFKNNHDGIDLSDEIIRVQNLRNKYVDEDYKNSRDLYDSGRQQEAIANYAKEYGAILDAEEEIYNSKTDQDRLSAIKEYRAALEAAKSVRTDDSHMDDYFNEIGAKFDEQEFELKVKLDEDGLKSNLAKIIQNGGENGLSVLDDVAIKDMVKRGLNFEGATDVSGKYTQEQIDGLILLQAEADKAGVSVESLIAILTTLGIIAGQPVEKSADSVKIISETYSALLESVDEYNEILDQTSEIVSDNTKVSQEYKDSLSALGISQEELNECFDDQNPLIVKNANALNKLVKSANKNVASNVKLAKTQARLQYYELYKKMNDVVNGTRVTDAATLDYINTLYSQMTALEKTIAKYSMLEAQLLGTTNAYNQLADAQSADEATDYGSKAEELVNVLANAFNTSELGTESAQVAISGLIPDDVIDKAKALDEQMSDIYKYFTTGTMSKLFKIEFDNDGGISSVEMTKENIEGFVNELLNTDFNGLGTILQGTWDEFTLNPEIDSLKEFADACAMTEEVAFAFLTALEKYDISWLGGDGTTLLDKLMGDDLEYRIYDTTQKLADLDYQLATGKISAEEYQSQMYGLKGTFNSGAITADEYSNKVKELKEQLDNGEISVREYNTALNGLSYAYDALGEYDVRPEVNAWIEVTAQLQEAKGELQEYYDILNSAELGEDGIYRNDVGEIIDVDKIQKDIDATMEKANELSDKLVDLEEPTQLTLQFASDSIQKDLDAIEKQIGDLIEGTHYTFNVASGQYTVTLNENDPNYKKVVEFVNLLNQQHVINAQMGEDTPTVTDQLQSIADILTKISDLLEKKYVVNVDTSTALSNTKTLKSVWDSISSKAITITQTIKTLYDSYDGDTEAINATKVNGTAHVNGTAYKSGSWGAHATETALVGELGPELLVRGNQWTTIGENGAEFTQVKKGDIIFNHKQTESLLKNGYITGRGKLKGGSAFVSGTAYAGINTWDDAYNQVHNDYKNSSSNGSASDAAEDAAEEFREVFDWIAIRLEEITEGIDLKSANLENAIGSTQQNAIIDDMIALNEKLYDNLLAGADRYYSYAKTLLSKIPSAYREAAQNGTIAIEEFVGEVDEETLEAIQNYRDWVQKGSDATQQAEEVLTEISSLAKQAIDNIANDYDNKASIRDNEIDQLDAYNALLETKYGSESASIYKEIISETNKGIASLEEQRNKMQSELNEQVNAGNIKKYSQDWYDAINDIAALDSEIIELTKDTYDYQDSINEIRWDNFDTLIEQYEMISNEAENLIDILGTKDVVNELGEWTDEGIATLGLYAQQMENAEMQAEKYREEIDYLNKNWESMGLTQQEYIEKLDELKSGQYDAIKAYNDTKDAIVDLNKERVDAIKNGIEKEIEAYEELIDTKKKALEAEKDAVDFQRSIEESTKEISDIERQIAALSADNSASARSKRAKLEAELLKAQQDLQDKYYDRSIQDQQDALDKELESFQKEKDAELEGWDEYLENTKQVVSDSLSVVQSNTEKVYATLKSIGQEYSLNISAALTSPWKDGEDALQSYSDKFGLTMSSTVDKLQEVADEYKTIMDGLEDVGNDAVNKVNANTNKYQSEKQAIDTTTAEDQKTVEKTIKVGGKINAGNAKIYESAGDTSGEKQYYYTDPIYKVLSIDGDWVQVRHHKLSTGVTGWFRKNQVKAYAKGTTGVKNDQLALIDELGDELIMHADGSGKLAFLSKGSAVIPHDISENLMQLGELNPQDILDRNRPVVSAPHITNNNIELNVSFGEVVHIDHVDNNAVPNLAKTVEKQIDKYMKGLNAEIRKYVR